MKLRPLQSISSSTTNNQSPTPPPLSDSTTTTTGTLTLTLTVTNLPLATSDVKLLSIHNHLLYAATENLIHVIKTSPFTPLDTFTVGGSSSGSVKSIAFNNGLIYTAHQDNKIRVWKLTENKRYKRIATLPTLEDRLLRSVLPKNYVNVRRHTKKLWIEHHDAVSGIAFIADDQLMCSASWDKCLKIWRTSDLRCKESINAHDDAINAVVVAPDGTIFTASADRRIKVWRKTFRKYGLVATLDKHKCSVNALSLSDDGWVLYSGGSDGLILVWEREDGTNHVLLTRVLRGHLSAVLCLSSLSSLLFSGSADRTVRIWQCGYEGNYYCLKLLDGYERPVRSLVADLDRTGDETGCKSSIRVFSECPNGVIRLITIKGLNV